MLRLVTKRTLLRPTSVTVYELTEAGRALAPTIRALSAWGQEHGLPTTKAQTLRPAWILLSVARRASRVARRGSQLDAGRSCELRVGEDVFELTGTATGIDVTAGAPRSPDAVVTMKPDLLYALASRRKTPQFALERFSKPSAARPANSNRVTSGRDRWQWEVRRTGRRRTFDSSVG